MGREWWACQHTLYMWVHAFVYFRSQIMREAEGPAFQIAVFSFFYSLLGYSYYKLDLGAIFLLCWLNAFLSRNLWSW